jgi:DNA repair exonuclease SbcCD ATPase subunit
MTRRGVSYEDVAQAAEELRSQGELPTIERIRHLLGGTGSNTTISKYLNEWRHFAMTTKVVSQSDPVQTAVQRVWQQLREETDAEIKKTKEESNKIIEEAQTKEHLAFQRTEELENQFIALKNQFYELQGAKEILALDFKKLQEEHALLQERYKGLDERYADFQRITVKHQEDMSQAHEKEITHIIEKSQLQDDANQKLISELKNHNEVQRQNFIVEADLLKTKNQQLKKEIEQSYAKIKTKEIELEKLKTELNAIIKERDQLTEQVESQKRYWSVLDKNIEITSSILSEVKEIPKFDFTLSSIRILTEANNNFSKFTNETQSLLDEFNKKIKGLNVDGE